MLQPQQPNELVQRVKERPVRHEPSPTEAMTLAEAAVKAAEQTSLREEMARVRRDQAHAKLVGRCPLVHVRRTPARVCDHAEMRQKQAVDTLKSAFEEYLRCRTLAHAKHGQLSSFAQPGTSRVQKDTEIDSDAANAIDEALWSKLRPQSKAASTNPRKNTTGASSESSDESFCVAKEFVTTELAIPLSDNR